jgi:hypothetical protein
MPGSIPRAVTMPSDMHKVWCSPSSMIRYKLRCDMVRMLNVLLTCMLTIQRHTHIKYIYNLHTGCQGPLSGLQYSCMLAQRLTLLLIDLPLFATINVIYIVVVDDRVVHKVNVYESTEPFYKQFYILTCWACQIVVWSQGTTENPPQLPQSPTDSTPSLAQGSVCIAQTSTLPIQVEPLAMLRHKHFLSAVHPSRVSGTLGCS